MPLLEQQKHFPTEQEKRSSLTTHKHVGGDEAGRDRDPKNSFMGWSFLLPSQKKERRQQVEQGKESPVKNNWSSPSLSFVPFPICFFLSDPPFFGQTDRLSSSRFQDGARRERWSERRKSSSCGRGGDVASGKGIKEGKKRERDIKGREKKKTLTKKRKVFLAPGANAHLLIPFRVEKVASTEKTIVTATLAS